MVFLANLLTVLGQVDHDTKHEYFRRLPSPGRRAPQPEDVRDGSGQSLRGRGRGVRQEELLLRR